MTDENDIEKTEEQESVVDSPETAPEKDAGEDKPKTLREILSDAYDKAEKEGGDDDGKEKRQGQGDKEVLKQGEVKADNSALAKPKEEALKPHDFWPQDVKEKFAKLPRDFQEFLLKRNKDMEGDYTRKTKEIAPLKRITETFNPFLTQIQTQYNQPPERVIGAALTTLQTLVYGTPEQKRQEWLQVAQQYGIDLNQGQPQQQEEWVDPDVKALRDQNAMLLQKMQQFENKFISREQLEYENTYKNTNNEIDSFIGAKTDSGEPAHPYASEPRVMQEMAVLANAYRSNNIEVPPLGELYKKAIFSLPDIREKLLQREKETALQEFKTKNVNKLNQARTAASGITQQSYSNGQIGKPKTTRQLLEDAWDEQTSTRV